MKKINRIHKLAIVGAAVLCAAGASSIAAFAAEDAVTPNAQLTNQIEQAKDEKLSVYIRDDADFRMILVDGAQTALYHYRMFADVNADGKFNAADSREILRIAARLSTYEGKIAAIDANADGVVTAADARLSLRYNAKLDDYYFDADGKALAGFLTTVDGKTLWCSASGCIARGYTQIGDDCYYFADDGVMLTGKQIISGSTYLFAEDGKGISGWQTFDEGRYYLKNGRSLTGIQTVDGKKYYFCANGLLLVGMGSEFGKTYYTDDDGVLKDGLVSVNGQTRLYRDGQLYSGWIYEGLNCYFYREDGSRAVSTQIGDIYFDANGVASAFQVNHQTLRVYLCGILKRNGATPYGIYNYVYSNFRYKYYDKLEPDDMVIRILSGGRGACYDYANLTKYLFEIAGYECKIIVGDSFNPNNGSEHDWVLVKINGAWRHVDAQRGVYLKTDSQMRALGYGWNPAGLPAAD